MASEDSDEYDQVEWEELLKEKQLDLILPRSKLLEMIHQVGHKIDEEGYVLDGVTGERILSIDGDEIRASQLAAALKGSEVLLKKNIASFSQYLSERGL